MRAGYRSTLTIIAYIAYTHTHTHTHLLGLPRLPIQGPQDLHALVVVGRDRENLLEAVDGLWCTRARARARVCICGRVCGRVCVCRVNVRLARATDAVKFVRVRARGVCGYAKE